jgi:hypothetical protein
MPPTERRRTGSAAPRGANDENAPNSQPGAKVVRTLVDAKKRVPGATGIPTAPKATSARRKSTNPLAVLDVNSPKGARAGTANHRSTWILASPADRCWRRMR